MGGPAERCGRILRGDEVETIDGVNVRGKTINDVRPLILGPAGTFVTLGLRRESEDAVVYVRVMREPVRLGEVLVPGMRAKAEEPAPVALSPVRAQAPPPEQPQAPPAPPSRAAVGRAAATLDPQPQPQPQPSQPPVQQAAPQMCGVGVVLVQVGGGAVCVKSVNKGGAAFQSGQILRGDVLHAIDGRKVLGWDVESVKPLILGVEGEPIRMAFQRIGNQVHGKRMFEVTLIRKPTPQALQ